MVVERYYLSEDKRVHLTVYLQDETCEIPLSSLRPMVLVCPGGGYCMTSDREAEPIALAYLAAGFNAAVLRYSVGEYAVYPNPLVDLSRAMKLLRDKATYFKIDKNKIAVCGFSAGGHLVGTLGVYWNDSNIQKLSGCSGDDNRPNALILGYPVITALKYAHEGSIDNLAGGADKKENMREFYSCEKHVGPHTPPTFLFHTCEDSCVPVANSLLFAEALAANSIKFELHIYQKGEHGLALSNRVTYNNPSNLNPDAEEWMRLSCNWLWQLFT